MINQINQINKPDISFTVTPESEGNEIIVSFPVKLKKEEQIKVITEHIKELIDVVQDILKKYPTKEQPPESPETVIANFEANLKNNEQLYRSIKRGIR